MVHWVRVIRIQIMWNKFKHERERKKINLLFFLIQNREKKKCVTTFTVQNRDEKKNKTF